MKRILLVSGGIDSSIMMIEHAYSEQYKGVDCELLYVRCGEVYEDSEINHLRFFIEKYSIPYRLNVIDINNADTGIYSRFVPNRNMTIASIAVTSLGADEIWIGGLKDDNVVDKNENAYKIMSYVLSMFSEKQITVKSPYSDFTKGELVSKFLRNPSIPDGTAELILKDTFSCYSSGESACGDCPACFRKFVALESNGIDSGITLSKNIISYYLQRLHTYPVDRINRTLIALRGVFGGIECYDLDGTLCMIDRSVPYSEKEVIDSVRRKVNASTKLRMIYTSRLESDRKVTEEWLRKNDIHYEVLLMNKPNYDIIYDDRAKALT